MSTKGRRGGQMLLLFALMGGALLGQASADTVTPQSKKPARLLFKEGVESFNLGHYEEAADQCEAAYRLASDPALLFNSAQAYRLAG